MSKIRVYISHPIQGSKGKKATAEDMAANNLKAIVFTKKLRRAFPFIDFYCPAEHDEVLILLFTAKKTTVKDILWADCEIVKRCDAILFLTIWEGVSNGMEIERQCALENNITTSYITEWDKDTQAYLDRYLNFIKNEKENKLG